MQGNISSASDNRTRGTRVLQFGILAIVAILSLAALLLFMNLPDANAFNDSVERIFIENDAITTGESIRLLEVLAQSGTAFSKVLASYRAIIFRVVDFCDGSFDRVSRVSGDDCHAQPQDGRD